MVPLPPPMSQVSMQQQQQHIIPQNQVNPLHQQHAYPFFENLLPPPPPPSQQQGQQQFSRVREFHLVRVFARSLPMIGPSFWRRAAPSSIAYLCIDLFIIDEYYRYRYNKLRFFECSIIVRRKLRLLDRCKHVPTYAITGHRCLISTLHARFFSLSSVVTLS